jgi:hypothetical protein
MERLLNSDELVEIIVKLEDAKKKVVGIGMVCKKDM